MGAPERTTPRATTQVATPAARAPARALVQVRARTQAQAARPTPDGREGGKQPLSVLHDVVSFMGRGRWTYSYSTRLTTEMHEERTHHEAGATAFRER